MKCEVGKGDGVRDRHSAAVTAFPWAGHSQFSAGTDAAGCGVGRQRHASRDCTSGVTPCQAMPPIECCSIILSSLFSSVLAQGDDGASSTSASLLDQVDGQEFRIVSIYLFIRIWQHSSVRRDVLLLVNEIQRTERTNIQGIDNILAKWQYTHCAYLILFTDGSNKRYSWFISSIPITRSANNRRGVIAPTSRQAGDHEACHKQATSSDLDHFPCN